MPLGRRGGRPGLIGTAARTAVIAGTAGAVSNRQQNRYAQQRADAQAQADAQAAAEQARFDAAVQQAAAQQVAAQPAPAPAAVAAPAPTGGGDDLLGQLQQLAQLQAAGILSPDEFAAAKAKLLS